MAKQFYYKSIVSFLVFCFIPFDNKCYSFSTGVQRIISGKMKLIGKSGNGKYSIQYTSLPGNYETTLNVLDTDYTSFAVIWSCTPIGPIGHTGNNFLKNN